MPTHTKKFEVHGIIFSSLEWFVSWLDDCYSSGCGSQRIKRDYYERKGGDFTCLGCEVSFTIAIHTVNLITVPVRQVFLVGKSFYYVLVPLFNFHRSQTLEYS